MAYLNKVFLIGNVGKDPEIRATQSGQKKASFTFATTERFKDRTTGENRDRTEWHNIVAWRSSAEQIERLGIRKGTALHIEGRITYRSWDDPSGQKKYMTEIEVDRFQILTPRSQGGSDARGQTGNAAYADDAGGYDQAGDDLPF